MMELDLRDAARHEAVAIAPPGALGPAVIATWRGRMIQEHGSSHVFAGLAAQLDALDRTALPFGSASRSARGALDDAGAAAEARGFAAEERAHGAMCGAVVVAAGGEAYAEVAVPRVVPVHADTSPRAAVLRNVISICCLSETVAVALIGAERLEMPDGPLRELLTRIWSDEVGHARFGWRYLARELPLVTSDELDAIARYLPVAFGALEQHELAHLPGATAWPPEAACYGLCDGGDARALFQDTVTDVIIPQLAALGLPAERAWQTRVRRTA